MDSLIHVIYMCVMYFKDIINSDSHMTYLHTGEALINLIKFSKKLAIKIRSLRKQESLPLLKFKIVMLTSIFKLF